ncbi:MAG: NADH dehydrogenase subunit 3 [Desulfobacteraceae bacterium]|nr:NADH dehydrogenase subunit 3 [Desulfobacteraceae bacterium]
MSLLLAIVNIRISKKSLIDSEKSSPFECGFIPKSLPRTPLSLRFFLIALVFLVFDVELILLFPIFSLIRAQVIVQSAVLFIIVLILLTGGIYYEINQGRLNWAK